MVEILKRGTPPKEKSYEAYCRTCSSHLRFKVSETKFVCDRRDGDYRVLQCPVCQSDITIATSLLLKMDALNATTE